MKIFLDTADSQAIELWIKTGLIDGITTNPTTLSKVEKNPVDTIRHLCTLLPKGDISVEVTEKDPEKVYTQAKKIAALAPNIVVKIPCHRDYYPIINRLVAEGIPINVTLVFTLIQGLLMSKLGVRYISPFIGRWDMLDIDASPLLYELRETVDRYQLPTHILAASMRTVNQVHEALNAGVDVITVSIHILEQMTTHLLTDAGIAQFDADWHNKVTSIFP